MAKLIDFVYGSRTGNPLPRIAGEVERKEF